jgi:signal transduction histidine kinase
VGRDDARAVELSASERQLLAPLAHRVGAVVQNARLAAELREASERLLDARERERHRLRRDLHDGLGPTLASMALQLDVAASGRVELDPVLLDVRGHAQSAVGEIRRLVQELRPPALDELGLVGAIRRQAEAYPPLAVRVESSGVVELPAAVEVAAYRIAVEAVNNAARHANARECVVRLTFNGALELDVADDGRGIPADARASVGLGSMRERAAELGGVCTIARRSTGGTRVHAVIPIEERA